MNDKTLVERLRALIAECEPLWKADLITHELDEKYTSECKLAVPQLLDAIEALQALNADLQRRLDNICNNIHTCSGDQCERPVCVERRRADALQARVMVLEEALREALELCGSCGGIPSYLEYDSVTGADLWTHCPACADARAALQETGQ